MYIVCFQHIRGCQAACLLQVRQVCAGCSQTAFQVALALLSLALPLNQCLCGFLLLLSMVCFSASMA